MMRLLYCGVLATAALLAQGSVTIYGTVTDASGSLIPGTAVRILQVETGQARSVVSNERGDYVATQLPIGAYTVSAERQGFKKFVQTGIRVQVDENRQVPITLQIGDVAESVTVQAESVQVETRSGTLKEVIDSKRIVELPLNGRNALDLQRLVPGAGAVADRGQGQNNTISINGSRQNGNNYVLDGGDNHDPYFNSPAVFPPPDALEEFSINTNAYSAEYGRNAGALMNAVTRSGTNDWHGSLFEFLRNDKLNARNFFSNTVPPFKRNQFGGTFGGRIIRDKTFFFVSYQGTRDRSAPGAQTANVPSAAERRGDFSGLARAITDPANGNQPFPNRTIPASRISQPSIKFLEAFVPLPNRADGLFSFASQQSNDQDNTIFKIDHQLSSANRLSGRFLMNDEAFQEVPGNLPNLFANIKYSNYNLSLSDTHILSATLLNSFQFTFNDIDRRQLSVVPGNKSWNDFGARFTRPFTETDVPTAISTNVNGRFNAFTRYPLQHFRRNYEISERLNWNRGAHFLKVGGSVRLSQLDLSEFFEGDPALVFNGQITGDSAADLMLGRVFNFRQGSLLVNQPRQKEWGLFAQDDWKVKQKLTLNLGLRYDPFLPFTDADNRFSQFRPGQQSTVFPTAPAGVVFPGDADVPFSAMKANYNRLAPRFGFAWDPTGKGKFSVRGGYGMFWSQIRQQANNQPSNSQPFAAKFTFDAPPSVENPYALQANPWPFTAPTSAEARKNYRFIRPLTMQPFAVDFSNGYMQQWNFNLQREFFGSWVGTLAYVGSKGTHLFNQIEGNPAVFRAGATTANTNARRLFAPDFGTVALQKSDGNSNYNSMQVSVNKRFTRGYSLMASYTWSKMIDDASGDGTVSPNPFDQKFNRGLSNLDIPHRFVGSFVYELPRFQNGMALLKYVVGGWDVNGIVSLQSGTTFTVISGRDNSFTGVNQDRADLIGNPYLDAGRPNGQLVDRYFNIDAFAFNAIGTYGTAGRNILRGPGDVNLDFGLFKNIPVTERHKVQFRMETFNALNRVNLGNPNANRSAAAFGRITSAGSPRVIQLALKYQF
jgi:outer membrane receptor protein involved in Fe transport